MIDRGVRARVAQGPDAEKHRSDVRRRQDQCYSSLITRHSTFAVLALGAVIECVLLFGLVRPLWLFGHHAAIPTPEPLATILGINLNGLLHFAGVLVVWLTGYGAASLLVRGPLTTGARRALAVLPLVFAVTLLFVLPVSSKDVYHYLMEGRAVTVYGHNPMSVPPGAYPDDRFGWTISSWGDTPSRYGPLFNLLAAGVTRVGGDSLAVNLLLFKLIATAALLGTAALTWLTMRRLRPELALAAFVLVAWNPLALYEAAVNAHNDLLMVFSTALALYLATRRHWAAALPALALGVLTKYVVVLLGPLILMERGTGSARQHLALFRLPRSVWAGLGVSMALGVGLYAPFWNGPHTLDAITSASGDMLSSPGWLLRQIIKHPLGWERARLPVVVLLSLVFLAGYALILARHRREAEHGSWTDAPFRVPRFAFPVLLLELCTVSWWLWPWYTLWLLPAAALLAGRRAALLSTVATGAALLAYIPLNFRELFWGPATTDRMPLTVVLVMFLPALAVAMWRGPGRRTEH